MGLVTPGIGLVFWTTLAFLIVLFLLGKFAWKPILSSIKEREDSIEGSLKAAENAQKEMQALQSKNEELIFEARKERDLLLKDAKDTSDKMISDAKSKSKLEGDKMIVHAREEIANEKAAALSEIKEMVSSFSIEIAEKLLRDKLATDGSQKALVSRYIDDLKLN
jgi:F-type H+-transporting ATPase subunit b